MARVGFKMQLKAGNEVEYKRRHDEIWPELADLLHETGIRNYNIWRDGLTLFACLEIDDPAKMDEVPEEPIVKKWWAYMEPLMECNPDNSPVVIPLEEAFYMA
ncbi:MAG: L-rhamnose mutarotase [Candidatus Latescibacteria bacterium]|jgi:L-rhamnose mutarotase|nr:L-rhamnose mutarotase [Candidatus Latescibacterota bacterium]MDP7634577.1 L-rhamnose mutarotase [Candidatus Latescibacterota bacterium]HJP34026.1 L-rhamnose mutarotase [Candidatus Latescibacterota bacterium]|tara:strand:- start:223 stop:531 length:309 start_codon:yes stop_codon:yes gene_type:complete